MLSQKEGFEFSMFGSSMNWKSVLEYLLLSILLIPVFFINPRKTHDWGGDFAQYIQQAINIVEFKSQNEHHYIYNEEHPMLGPELYPVGFPLLLSPVVALFGNDIPILILYMNFWLLLCGLAFYSVLRGYYKALPAAALVLLLCYMPYLLIFKSEVMADLPFLFFILLAFRSYSKNSFNYSTALFLIIACLIKPYGLSLWLALLIDKLVRNWKGKESFELKQIAFFIFCLITPMIVNRFIFGVPSSLEAYTNNFSFGNLGETILRNLELYYQPFDNYLLLIDPAYETWAALLSILLFSLLFIGFSFRLFLYGLSSIELFILVHLSLLILFPSQAQAPRYLLTILPFLFIIVNESITPMQMRWPFLKNWPIYIVVSLNLGFYFANIPWINKNFTDPLPGPQMKESIECFTYLKNNFPKGEELLFKKPRVLGLYTGIDSYSNEPYQSLEELEIKFESMGTKYFLVNSHNHNEALEERFIPAHNEKLEIKWQNEHFVLYHLIDH
jgi:hypothetical protein